MNYAKMTDELREIATKLLEEKRVSEVWGFHINQETGVPTPYAATNEQEARELVWNDECYGILTSLIMEKKEKLAIAAKPCEVRALINLFSEKQLERENVHIIGMSCEGMKKRGKTSTSCEKCKQRVPKEYDVLIDGREAKTEISEKTPNSVTDWLNASETEERRNRLLKELDKCILCYSCRQACPGCYCKVCFIDRNSVNWRTDADAAEKLTYHLTRAMHLAGRCVDCGACENACPSSVKLKYLIDGLSEFVESEYGFRAGETAEGSGAMNTASLSDPETGFWGGDAQ